MHDANLLEEQPIAWEPTPEIIERAQLTRFMRQVGVATWDELYAFSIRDVERFTDEVIKFLDIRFDPPYEKLLDVSNGIEFPKWFTTKTETQNISFAGLNITEMCIDRWQTDEMKGRPAAIWENEDGKIEIITYSQLYEKIEQCASGLRQNGFQKGDAIGIHLPMQIETITALLAIARIGAIAVPVFSGYGIEAISSRLNAVEAKALITCDGFSRRGKFFNALEIAEKAASDCPTLKKLFIVRNKKDVVSCQLSAISYSEFDELCTAGKRDLALGQAERTTAEDPLIILYTSGTTGKPKGIAHTHASFPIKAAQDMAFGTDVGCGTRICWYTDIGWMMGPWLIYGALINGATICIYDGAPDYPTPDRMWEFCARHKVEVLGISPTLIRSLAAGSADTPVRMSAKHEQIPPTGESTIEPKSGGNETIFAAMRGSADTPVRMDAASASTKIPPPIVSERKGWYRHKLPHYDGNVTQFITFRLADSLPQAVIEKIKYRLDHDKFTNFSQEYRDIVEEYLDAGAGECSLHDPTIAELVESTILNEHGKSCDINAWVIMPNHVHVLLRPLEGHDLAGIMKRIKGVSARKINQFTGREGTVWQSDYFDRFIRDEDDFLRKIYYIENNPVKAGLVTDAWEWQFSSAALRGTAKGTAKWSADTPVRMSAKHEQIPPAGESAIEPKMPSDEISFAASGDADKSVRVPRHDEISFASTGDADKSVRAPRHDEISFAASGDADKSVRAPRYDLSSLRIFASTGEPWNPAPWWWLFEKVGNSKLPIINYSGGTEIAGGILMGNPLLPQKPCSFPAPCPGMDIDILNENGEPVKPGEVGELIIKQPWIGMARGFWKEKERYLETYWRRFKNIWVHGDWAMRDADGHWFILGRSDDTLKVAGKRVGPAEVESILVSHNLVTEAAVIGIPDEQKGTAMAAFCVLAMPLPVSSSQSVKKIPALTEDDAARKDELQRELKSLVAKEMGKPLAPSTIHFVTSLPKTRNAKVMRRVIRAAYLGEDPGDLSALENPGSVEEIAKIMK